MKKVIFVGIAIALFSCKRECDCQQQNNQLFYSENVDLPVNKEPSFETQFSLNIYIDEGNVIRLDSHVMTVEQIDSAMAVLSETGDENSQIKVYPAAKSDFEVFNEMLKLSLKYDLKIKIANQ